MQKGVFCRTVKIISRLPSHENGGERVGYLRMIHCRELLRRNIFLFMKTKEQYRTEYNNLKLAVI
jgi:hypothetical protein